jgi:hypothetical protein
MPTLTHNGEWFLPGSNLKIPGRLYFSDEKNKIVLETFSDRYLSNEPVIRIDPERDKEYNSKDYNDTYDENYILVNGNAHGKITLYNCHWDGTEDIGMDLYLVKYEVQFVFWSIHLSLISELLINSATLIYPFLSSWYDGWESLGKLRKFENKEFRFSDSINNSNLVAPIKIENGPDLIIYDSFSKRMEQIGVHHSLKYQKFIKFNYVKSIGFTDLLTDISKFSKLLEFCHGKPLKKKLLEIEFDRVNEENSTSEIKHNFTSPVGNYSLHEGADVESHSRHQRFMLLSRWRMESQELNNYIKIWFRNSKFYNIYDIYLDSNNWFQDSNAILSNVMFNNRFVNIVQALESYYIKVLKNNNTIQTEEQTGARENFDNTKKQVLSNIKDPKLKEWCNSNLNFKEIKQTNSKLETNLTKVLLSFDDIITPIFGENDVVKYFPRFASRIRNNLSHGLNDSTDQGDALRIFFQLGQILLAISILKTLDTVDIKSLIVTYDPFERSIYEIKLTKLVFK